MDHIHPRVLRCFVVLAEELHFGRAAQRLGVSQSTISEQLRNLEHDLGVVLFERHSRGVALSPVGHQLLDPARQLLADHAGFVQRARDAVAVEHGVTVGALAGAMPLVALLAEAAASAGIPLTLRTVTLTEGVRAVASGSLTTMIATVLDNVSMPGLNQIVLTTSELVAVMTPDHPLARFERIPHGALAGQRILVPSGYVTAIERVLGSTPLGPEFHEIPSLPHSAGELLAGGPVALSTQWLQRWWRNFNLVERALDPPLAGHVGLVVRSSLAGNDLVKVERLAELARPLMATGVTAPWS